MKPSLGNSWMVSIKGITSHEGHNVYTCIIYLYINKYIIRGLSSEIMM